MSIQMQNQSKTCMALETLSSEQFPVEEMSKSGVIYLQITSSKCQANVPSV